MEGEFSLSTAPAMVVVDSELLRILLVSLSFLVLDSKGVLRVSW